MDGRATRPVRFTLYFSAIKMLMIIWPRWAVANSFISSSDTLPIRFVIRCLLYGLPVLAMLMLYCGLNARYFPTPHVTRNIAVNEVRGVLTHGMPAARPDVLAFGSSMALNNLASNEVIAHFGAQRYFNLGAWGLDMVQTCELAGAFAERYHPRVIVIAGNLRGFRRSGRAIGVPVGSGDGSGRAGLGRASTWPTRIVYYLRQMESNKLRYNDAPGTMSTCGWTPSKLVCGSMCPGSGSSPSGGSVRSGSR